MNRKNQLKSSKCGSGDVGIFIKNTLLNKWHFREIDSSVDGLFVRTLYNETTDSKIVLVPCYIPPEDSAWSMDCEYVYNHLTSVLFSLEDVAITILGGDVNAKIGDKVDFIPDIDVIPERVVLDNSNNKHVESFINFLLANKMCVVNGRIMQGKDNFMYITRKGKSVVDYFVTSMKGLKYCKKLNILSVTELLDDMQIIPDCAIPDHSILLLDLDMTELTPIDNLLIEKNIEFVTKYLQ